MKARVEISWSPSSVRSLLFRQLYLGEVVWNKTKSGTHGHAGTTARKRIAEDLYAAAPDHLYERMESSSQSAGD
jgi:hypothetical protein